MYQTRHTFASNALAAGESPTWVARMLGHATPEMLFKVYARFIPNLTRRDGSALAARMGPKEAAAYSRNTPDGDRFRSGDQGNQGVVLGGFPKSTFGTFFASAGASKYFCGRKPKAFA